MKYIILQKYIIHIYPFNIINLFLINKFNLSFNLLKIRELL